MAVPVESRPSRLQEYPPSKIGHRAFALHKEIRQKLLDDGLIPTPSAREDLLAGRQVDFLFPWRESYGKFRSVTQTVGRHGQIVALLRTDTEIYYPSTSTPRKAISLWSDYVPTVDDAGVTDITKPAEYIFGSIIASVGKRHPKEPDQTAELFRVSDMTSDVNVYRRFGELLTGYAEP